MAAAICPKCGKRFPASDLNPGQVFNCLCGATVRVPDYPRRRNRATEHPQDVGSTPLGMDDQVAFDRAFAKTAVERGFVTDKQVTESLEAQKLMSKVGVVKNLDQVMVDKGLITIYQAKRLSMLAKEGGRITEIGGFQITGKLGKGGMGTVYRAHQVSLDRDVALKVLPRQLAENKSYLERFLREARSAAKLNHPNIVQAIDVGEDRGYFYFAMELVEGESLRSILRREKKLPVGQACRITLEIAKALDYAWQEQRIIHRDVKPDNILLNKRGQAKLADLGLVKSALMDSGITVSGAVVGTPNFISPEQVEAECELDPRSDMYSLGCTFFNMVTGRVPFKADSPAAVFLKHVTQGAPDPREFNPDIPAELALIILRMMAKNREDRYMSLGEVARILEGFPRTWHQKSGEPWLGSDVGTDAEIMSTHPTLLISGALAAEMEAAQRTEVSDTVPPPIPGYGGAKPGAEAASDAATPVTPEIAPAPTSQKLDLVTLARDNLALSIGLAFLGIMAVIALVVILVQSAHYRPSPERPPLARRGPGTGKTEPTPAETGSPDAQKGEGPQLPVTAPPDATQNPEPVLPPRPGPEIVLTPAVVKELPALFPKQLEVVATKELTPAQRAATQLLQGRTNWFSDGTLEVIYDFVDAKQCEDFGLFDKNFPPGGGFRIESGSIYKLVGQRPENSPDCFARWMPTHPFQVTLRTKKEKLTFKADIYGADETLFEIRMKDNYVTATSRKAGGAKADTQTILVPDAKEALVTLAGDGAGKLFASVNGHLIEMSGVLPSPFRVRVGGESEEKTASGVITYFAMRAQPDPDWLKAGTAALNLKPERPVSPPTTLKKDFITVRRDGKGDYASLVEAINHAADGAVIEIADMGPYKIETSQDIQRPLTIRGNPRVMPLVELSAPGDYSLRLGSRCRLQGIFFQVPDREKGANPAVGIVVENARGLSITECTFLSGANASSLRLKGSASGLKITDSLFVGWPFGKGEPDSTGITTYAWTGRDLTINHCTFWGEAKWNSVVTHFNQPNPAPVSITNSIVATDDDVEFGKVGRWEFNCYAPGTVIARRLLAAGTEGERPDRKGKRNFVAWPDFKLPFNFDFALQTSSPCRAFALDGKDVGIQWSHQAWVTFYEAAALAHVRRSDFGVPLQMQERIDLLDKARQAEWVASRGEQARTISGLEFAPDPRCYWFRAVREWKLALEWSSTGPGDIYLCTPPVPAKGVPNLSFSDTARVTVHRGPKEQDLETPYMLQTSHKLEASLNGSTLKWSFDGTALPDMDVTLHPSQVPFLFDFKGKLLIKKAEVRLAMFTPRMLTEFEEKDDGTGKAPPKVRLSKQLVRPSGEKIFDGVSLDGWRTYGGNWAVQNGEIVGKGDKGDAGHHYLLIYQKFFLPKSEFKLWYSFRADEGASGDLYFKGVVFSLARLTQGEIRVMPVKKVSYLSKDISDRNDKEAVTMAVKSRFPAGRWLPVLASTDGNTLTLWVNGEQVLDYTVEKPADTNIGFFYSKFNSTMLRDIWLDTEGTGKRIEPTKRPEVEIKPDAPAKSGGAEKGSTPVKKKALRGATSKSPSQRSTTTSDQAPPAR